MENTLRKRLQNEIEGKVFFNIPLAPHTSFKVGGPADYLIIPSGVADLKKVLLLLYEYGVQYFVLGRGTNILVSDKGFRGAVLQLEDGFQQVSFHNINSSLCIVRSGAGVVFEFLITRCVQQGLSGIENLSGIPGTFGGAIKMNAGAFGAQIKDFIKKVSYVVPGGDVQHQKAETIQFLYRNAILPHGAVIVEGALKLKRASISIIESRKREILEKRKQHFPLSFPCAGSVFKNPQGSVAGRLIEEAGLKGTRIGDAQISPEHGNFIVNLGRATAQQILELIYLTINTVRNKKGIILEPEICIIGEHGRL